MFNRLSTTRHIGAGNRNNPHAENIARLLAAWREKGFAIFSRAALLSKPKSPLHETNEGNAFKEAVKPTAGETDYQKSVNGAFIGTNLQEYLQAQGIAGVVIVGLITNPLRFDHCPDGNKSQRQRQLFPMLRQHLTA